jgi:hypothetical protein
MIATLTFNIPEEQDAFNTAANALKYKKVVDDILAETRHTLKHNPLKLSEAKLKIVRDFDTRIREELMENNLPV